MAEATTTETIRKKYTDEQLDARFGALNRFFQLSRQSPAKLLGLLEYICFFHGVFGRKKERFCEKFTDAIVRRRLYDADVYKMIRRTFPAGVNTQHNLGNRVQFQAREIFRVLQQATTAADMQDYSELSFEDAISAHKRSFATILDIGTEVPDFLDELKRQQGGKCRVTGINIEVGYDHYMFKSKSSVKIQKYNGYDIPADRDSQDLVIAMSVLHHVPPEILPLLLENMARVCRRYIVLKENNLENPHDVWAFEIQHESFEGVFVPALAPVVADASYTNFDFKVGQVVEFFKMRGFDVFVYSKEKSIANAGFYVFRKTEAFLRHRDIVSSKIEKADKSTRSSIALAHGQCCAACVFA